MVNVCFERLTVSYSPAEAGFAYQIDCHIASSVFRWCKGDIFFNQKGWDYLIPWIYALR
jgi:hypothetical protein